MEEKVYINYTNDLHSDFEQWPRTVSFLKEKKHARKQRGDAHFLVDSGDHMDRVAPISEALMGKGNVELLNEVGYDVVTMGNNEGITLAHDDLYHLYDEANFDVVCANLYHQDEKPPAWLFDTKVLATESGIQIGFIGLTAPFQPFYERLGWDVSDPHEELETQLQALSEKTDIIVLLSHLGLSEDEEIARRFPDIDVIIGGHTHHLLRTEHHVNNTVITAAGKHCFYAGEVILTFDHENRQLTKKEAYTINVTNYEKDARTTQLLTRLQKEADEVLQQEVVQLNEPFEAKWFEETKLMQDFTDMIRKWTDADIALLNAGLLLDDLPKGTVTYGDIHRICPHPINPVAVNLRGDELIEVIRGSFKKDFMELPLKGFGFRGKLIGRMLFSGITIETRIHKDGTETVKSAQLPNGESVDKQKTYRIGTADTFTFGRLLPEIAKSEVKEYYLPEFLREILIATLKDKYKADVNC